MILGFEPKIKCFADIRLFHLAIPPLKKMELTTGFEPVSTDYKSAILPIELCKLGAGTGIEPVSQAYETCQLTFCYILQWSHGAESNYRHEGLQPSALHN